MTDLIAGHIPAMVPDFGTGLPQLKAQKIRPLAVLTRERSATPPDMPSLHETVMPNYDLLAWARMLGGGVEVFYTGPKECDAYVRSELIKWTGPIKEVGIQPE